MVVGDNYSVATPVRQGENASHVATAIDPTWTTPLSGTQSHATDFSALMVSNLTEAATFRYHTLGAADDYGTTTSSLASAGFRPWDNPENIMSHSTSHTIETLINVGFVPPISLIGIVANITNMVVFAKQGLRDRINLCLFSLAMADCGYLLALLIYKSFSLVSLISSRDGNFWKIRSLNTIIGVFWGFSTTSNLLTLLVSVERCLCVVSPLRAKQMLRTKVMMIIIVLIYVIVLSSSLIFNVKFKVGTKQDVDPTSSPSDVTDSTIYIAVLSDFYLQNKLFVDIVYNYIMAITLPFASLVCVIIFTAITVVFLKRSLSWKMTSAYVTAADRKENAVTKMLLTVCYVYVVCVTPSVLNAFVVQFVYGWIPTGRYSNAFYVYVSLMHLLTALNSSLNFFIYYFRGSKFRRSLGDFCCTRCRPGKQVEDNGLTVSVTKESLFTVSSN